MEEYCPTPQAALIDLLPLRELPQQALHNVMRDNWPKHRDTRPRNPSISTIVSVVSLLGRSTEDDLSHSTGRLTATGRSHPWTGLSFGTQVSSFTLLGRRGGPINNVALSDEGD